MIKNTYAQIEAAYFTSHGVRKLGIPGSIVVQIDGRNFNLNAANLRAVPLEVAEWMVNSNPRPLAEDLDARMREYRKKRKLQSAKGGV